MQIILVAPRGFCAGVNMAIESLRRAIELYGVPVYVFHEIVHNRWVVQGFRAQGAVFVDRLDEVPPGAVLLFSAHGVSPQVRSEAAQRRLRTIDATCPLVTKVHREAVRFAANGYNIVLIGHAGHDEVVGVLGEAPNRIHLVQTAADVDHLRLPDDAKLAYLTQTTLSMDDAAEIIDRLTQRYPQIVGPSRADICYATQNRQRVITRWCREADIVLVVGSRNSSNSRRLAELASSQGVAAHRIDGPDDLNWNWFTEHQTVMITAGASAPEELVQRCVEALQSRFHATVESRVLCREEVLFALPEPLRERPSP